MVTSYQLFSQRYGYFQARAKLPAIDLHGLQETLWLYPENETLYGPWPDSGEIDYGEFYSSFADADVPVVHYPGSTNDPNANDTGGCTIAGAPTAGQFNTYALLVDADDDHDLLQRDPLHHRHLRALRHEPRHCARALQPAVLPGLHRRARRRERRLRTGQTARAAGHHARSTGCGSGSTADCLGWAGAVGSRLVEFSKELHDDIAGGDITVTFRLWRRPQVKVGGRYRVGRVEIEVDSMDHVPFGSITDGRRPARRRGRPRGAAAPGRPRRADRRRHRWCTASRSTSCRPDLR